MRLLKSIILLFIMLLTFSCNVKESKQEQNEADEIIDGVYIPKDIDDCFIQLDKMLDDTIKAKMKSGSEDDMVRYHMDLGMYLRNFWGLWGKSRLASYFMEKGTRHTDDMSGIILTSYHRYLNGKNIALDRQIELSRAFYPPMRDMYLSEMKSFDNYGEFGEGFNSEGFPIITFYGKDTVTNLFWKYHTTNGWEKMSQEEFYSEFEFIDPKVVECEN